MFFTRQDEHLDTLRSLRAEGLMISDIYRAFQVAEGSLTWEERWVGGEIPPHSERMEHLYWEMLRYN